MANNIEPEDREGAADVSIRRLREVDRIGGRPRGRIHHTGVWLEGHNRAGAEAGQMP